VDAAAQPCARLSPLLTSARARAQVVPESLFPNLTRITRLELNHNSIAALPSDISSLQ
jgi:hypothetical protein